MRLHFLLLGLFFFCIAPSAWAQTDSTGAMPKAASDSLSRKDSLLSPASEQPASPTPADSSLNSTTTFTTTPLKQDSISLPPVEPKKINPPVSNDPPALGEVFKPKLAIGTGMMSFWGDLYSKHYQAPWTARIGYDMSVSQRLTPYLQLNFNVLFGKLGANEWTDNRQQNFQSEIRSGGISLTYDFQNLIPARYKIRPWVSFGVSSFEFLSKTDLYDGKGNKYYYWSDGSIKNMAQGSPGSQYAKDLVRDYIYESDIRELNMDGFGKYAERAWAFPAGFGAIINLNERVDFKIGVQYFFTTTDYIDGITNNSVGNRAGTKGNDKFVYTSFALQYDLVFTKKGSMPESYFEGVNWIALDNDDYDKDGVRDWDDSCQCTAANVKVDRFGCPLDDDKDGVPNYRDDEPGTLAGMPVNMRGVTLDDRYWKNWHDFYFDSVIFDNRNKEVLVNIFDKNAEQKKLAANEKMYTVEIARYQGGVPPQDMAYLLSVQDVKSRTLPDGSTIVYTAGKYRDVREVMRRRDLLNEHNGNKNARIGYYIGDKYYELTEEELQKLLDSMANKPADPLAGNNAAAEPGNAAGSEGNSADDIRRRLADLIPGSVVYRVQLGAFRKQMSLLDFQTIGNVIELKTADNIYRYATTGYKTIEEAAAARADYVIEGYTDAFVTAYKDGKRIPLDQAGATMESDKKENMDESQEFSTIDKTLIVFKIQLGPPKRAAGVPDMDARTSKIKNTVEKQGTNNGMIRYTAGSYNDYAEAEKFMKELIQQGFDDSFMVAYFKGELISIQEALELLK